MLTNTQSAQVIEELVKGAADSGEPVTITPVDEDALRAGARALRDEALERAEAKAWSVVMFLDGVHRHKLIENYSPDYAGLQEARTDAAELLAAIRAARGGK